LAAAVILRAVAAGGMGAASVNSAALFAVMLFGLALLGGWRPGLLSPAGVGWGLAGGTLLAAGPLIMARGAAPLAGVSRTHVALWLVAVTAVASSEEIVLRGALWDRLTESHGAPAALVVTTTVFALMHLPLYGWKALPLDLGVGLLLGGLRAFTGGVAAPALAHVIADVVGGFL
jgi:membrane protease YdiL (CAAX protease family)